MGHWKLLILAVSLCIVVNIVSAQTPPSGGGGGGGASSVCSASIDVWFNQTEYFVGDMGELYIKVWDKNDTLMPNTRFNITYSVNGASSGPYEGQTDSTGQVYSYGKFSDYNTLGVYDYGVSITKPGCTYIDDSFTFTLKSRSNQTCTDSDGGKNEYVYGYTQIGPDRWIDQCYDKYTVNENFCIGSSALTELMDCPDGCVAGVCIPTPVGSCIVPDEVGNTRCRYYGKSKGGPAVWVQECKSNGAWTNTNECTNGCENGACKTCNWPNGCCEYDADCPASAPYCVQSAAKEGPTVGTGVCNPGNSGHYCDRSDGNADCTSGLTCNPNCDNYNDLSWCSPMYPDGTANPGSDMYCESCYKVNDVCASKATCTDSDNGIDYYTYGWAQDSYDNQPFYDYCTLNGRQVSSCTDSSLDCGINEKYCGTNNRRSGHYISGSGFDTECPNGCANGACITDPSQDKLVAYYSFEGSARDVSGHGNDGRNIGRNAYTSGILGNGMSFDGSSDVVIFSDILDNDISSAFTISAWIKLDTGALNKPTNYIFWKSDDQPGIRVSNNVIIFSNYYTKTGCCMNSTTTLQEGKWYFVTFVYDGSTFKGYINSALEVQQSDNLGFSPGGAVRIGADEKSPGYNRYFKGVIDEVKVYNYALNPLDISDEYNDLCKDGSCNPVVCKDGETQKCGSDVGECTPGVRTCTNGVWSDCIGGKGPVPEICYNGLDDDCDGLVDDGCITRCTGLQYFTYNTHQAKANGNFEIELRNGVNDIKVPSITLNYGSDSFTDYNPILRGEGGWDGTTWLGQGKLFNISTTSDLNLPPGWYKDLYASVEFDVLNGITGNTDTAACMGNNSFVDACTDSDGGRDEFVKGIATDGDGNVFRDHCLVAGGTYKYVYEYYCQGGSVTSEVIECQNSCRENACVTYVKNIENFRLTNDKYVFEMYYIFSDWDVDGIEIDKSQIQMRHLGGAAHTEYTMPCIEGDTLQATFVNNYSGHVSYASYNISNFQCSGQQSQCGDGSCGSGADFMLYEGNTDTRTIDGRDYQTDLISVGSNDATVRVNGNVKTIQKNGKTSMDGIDVYIADICYNPIATPTKHVVAMGMRPGVLYSGCDQVEIVGGLDLSSKGSLVTGDPINRFRSKLSGSDLPYLLASGVIPNTNDQNYTQTIYVGNNRLQYGDPYNFGYDDYYVDMGNSVTSPFYTYRLYFGHPVDFVNDNMAGESIQLMGNDFVFSSDSTNSKIVFFDSGVTVSLNEGDKTTVHIAGVSYDITMLGISQTGLTDVAIVQVNGQSDEVYEGQSRKIGGINIYAKEVNYLPKQTQVSNATLMLGVNKISLENGKQARRTVGSDETVLDGTYVTVTSDVSGVKALEIAVFGENSNKEYLFNGDSFVDPVLGGLTTIYENRIPTQGATIVLGETIESCPQDCGTPVTCSATDASSKYPDGNNPFLPGSCSECTTYPGGGSCGLTPGEICSSPNYVSESYCENNKCVSTEVYCPLGCSNGACNSGQNAAKIHISKGWNVISIPGNAVLGQGNCTQDQLKQWAFFWWYPAWGRYITLDEANTLDPSIKDEILKMSLWAHAPEKCYLEYRLFDDYYNISDLPAIHDDWNMVMFTNDMVGKKINDFSNNCNLLGSFRWDGVKQSWYQIDHNMIISSNELGDGWVTKSSNQCSLVHSVQPLTPPAFPTGWIIGMRR
jgi:hypothetical protein